MNNKTEKANTQQRKLTWGEIKKLVESAGVQDNDEVDQIDISWGNLDDFECHLDEDFGWQIRL